MALDCLAWLMRLRGRVYYSSGGVYIIGRGFASPLTYSLPVAVTYSRLRWVKEGLLLRPRVKPRGPCACPSPSPVLEDMSRELRHDRARGARSHD